MCRCQRWNGMIATVFSATAAALVLALTAVTAGTLARWITHVTGIWPL